MSSLENHKVKFIYFSHQTLQIPRVAMQCIVSLCEGAAQSGADAEIVSYVTKIHPSEPAHPSFTKLYGISTPIRHTAYTLPGIGSTSLWVPLLRLWVYAIHLLRFILSAEARRYRYIILSARNYSVLMMLALVKRLLRLRFMVLADVHGMPSSRWKSWVHKIVDGNVCISQALADDLKAKLGLPAYKLSLARSGVKLERFASEAESKKELRRRLSLPHDKSIICYTGKVYYRYQEIEYLLQTAEVLDGEALILIVGGRPDQVCTWERERVARKISNVMFRSFVPPSQIPDYLNAADLLVMYYSPSPLNDYRSPGKLFEYMASGRPVVAGRTRSIEEIINDGENGFLVEPYQPRLLVEKIKQLLSAKDCLEHVGLNGRRWVENFTWRNRARHFLEYGRELADRSNFSR